MAELSDPLRALQLTSGNLYLPRTVDAAMKWQDSKAEGVVVKETWIILAIAGALCSCRGNDARPIAVHGDSTAIASRIPRVEKIWNVAPSLDGERWWNILGNSYEPTRSIFNDGVHGQSIAAMRDKMLANRAHSSDTTIIYDRVNSGEMAAPYLAALAQAVRSLQTSHFLILPQVPNAPGNPDPHAEAVMPAINAGLLVHWPRNTFGAAERDRFLVELAAPDTRADGVHRNAKGQQIEARYIKAWLDARGW